MSRNTTIAISVIAGLVFLCICVGIIAYVALNRAGQVVGEAVEGAIADDPAEVAQIAQGIVEYKLPPGYREQFGMSFFGFDMVAFGPAESTDQMIMLMQFPESAGLNQAEMEQQMKQSLQQQRGRQDIPMQEVDQVQRTIRDQTVTLTISEGTDSDGTAMRQMSGVFQGKNGAVLLMIVSKKQNWDQQAIDAFMTSLR
jgi:ribosomal protein S6E (S10)